jgi:hypothetical protein
MNINRYYILLLLCLVSWVSSYSYTINGKVITAQSKQGIAGAVVFINNTQKYALTDSSGNFSIENISETYFDIVVAHKLYAKLIYRYSAGNIGKKLSFELEQAPVDSVLIQSDSLIRLNNLKWSNAFMSNFVGISEYADCEVLNPEVLRFFYEPKKNILTIKATDQIRIINEALGYLMNICLDDFVIEGTVISYNRQIYFKPLHSKNAAVAEKWNSNREKLYKGSLQHFMRSFYTNTLENEGFSIRKISRIYDNEPAFQKYTRSSEINVAKTVFVNDSTNNSGRFIDMIERINTNEIRKQDVNSQAVFFTSKNPVQVTYKNAYLPYDYLRYIGFKNYATSFISSIETNPIRIESNGSYFESANIFIDGYWAWLKIASKLPGDYNANR